MDQKYPNLKIYHKFKANTVISVSEEDETVSTPPISLQIGDHVTFRYNYYWESTAQQKNEIRRGCAEVIKDKIKMNSIAWTYNGNVLENVKFSYIPNNEIMRFADKTLQQKFLMQVEVTQATFPNPPFEQIWIKLDENWW